MKAILEFNLDEQFEREAHLRAIKSTDLCLILIELGDYLRTKVNSEDIKREKEYKEILENLNELMEHYGINLDELIS